MGRSGLEPVKFHATQNRSKQFRTTLTMLGCSYIISLSYKSYSIRNIKLKLTRNVELVAAAGQHRGPVNEIQNSLPNAKG